MNWKPIPSLHGYEASDTGEIRNSRGTGKLLTQRFTWGNYKYIGLCFNKRGTGRVVNHLVAEAWIPNPENKPEVNHKNCNKSDNRIENLEWVTKRENIEHAMANGRYPKGDKHPNSKLSEVQVAQLRAHLSERKLTLTKLASMFGISISQVSQIYRGGRSTQQTTIGGVGYVALGGRKRVAAPVSYPDELILSIQKHLAEGHTRRETEIKFGATLGLVQRIAVGRRNVQGTQPLTTTSPATS